MKNLICLSSMALVVGLVGCGDDTGGSTTNNGGSGNEGGSVGEGGGGTGNTGTTGTGNNGGGGEGGSAGGEGGMGAGGAGSGADEFCTDYGTICSFGVGYADMAACVAAYNGYAAARQTCVETHLDLAVSEGLVPHCEHAAGAAPCN